MPKHRQPPYDDQNIFAKLLRGEIPSDVVYADERVLAFRDINPQAPHARRGEAPRYPSGSPGTGTLPNPWISAVTSAIAASAAATSAPFATSATPLPFGR